MYTTTSLSDSLVSNLSQEIEFLRTRSKNIIEALKSCHNNNLKSRLEKELALHQTRTSSITSIAKELKEYYKESISIDLLHEISKRARKHQEINL